MFQVIFTNEALVTILYTNILIPRHIRKVGLIRRIIVSHLCTRTGCQQFRKELRKLQTRKNFKRYYFFFHCCLLSCLQKSLLSKPKWGAQAVVRGGHGPPGPPVVTAQAVRLLFLQLYDVYVILKVISNL